MRLKGNFCFRQKNDPVCRGPSAKFADAELDAAGGCDLAAFFNILGRKDINNGHARIGNALFAGFGKVQHGLISTGEGGLCYTVIFLFVRRVEADGNGIKQPASSGTMSRPFSRLPRPFVLRRRLSLGWRRRT